MKTLTIFATLGKTLVSLASSDQNTILPKISKIQPDYHTDLTAPWASILVQMTNHIQDVF